MWIEREIREKVKKLSQHTFRLTVAFNEARGILVGLTDLNI
jgi:hypothetical protein